MQTLPQLILPEPQRNSGGNQSSDPRLPPDRNFCKCSGCGEYFLTVDAFDAHRVRGYRVPGDRHCQPTPQLREMGFERDPRGYWRLPKRTYSRPKLDLVYES